MYLSIKRTRNVTLVDRSPGTRLPKAPSTRPPSPRLPRPRLRVPPPPLEPTPRRKGATRYSCLGPAPAARRRSPRRRGPRAGTLRRGAHRSCPPAVRGSRRAGSAAVLRRQRLDGLFVPILVLQRAATPRRGHRVSPGDCPAAGVLAPPSPAAVTAVGGNGSASGRSRPEGAAITPGRCGHPGAARQLLPPRGGSERGAPRPLPASARPGPPRCAADARGRLASSVTSSARLPSCQNRGCLFHSSSQSTKGERSFNACVWTQAIIPNYCFSFEPAHPAGEPADEHALILPSRLISVGFAGQTGREGFVAFISM